jgi:hypothetical protein
MRAITEVSTSSGLALRWSRVKRSARGDDGEIVETERHGCAQAVRADLDERVLDPEVARLHPVAKHAASTGKRATIEAYACDGNAVDHRAARGRRRAARRGARGTRGLAWVQILHRRRQTLEARRVGSILDGRAARRWEDAGLRWIRSRSYTIGIERGGAGDAPDRGPIEEMSPCAARLRTARIGTAPRRGRQPADGEGSEPFPEKGRQPRGR